MTSNVTKPYFSSDTPLIRAVANGECGVGLVNTYYLARMLAGDNGSSDKALASKVKLVFPRPAHVNISGAGVVKTSKNPEAALKLIEFLASPSGGRGYAEANNEYPLKGNGNNPVLQRFGQRVQDVLINPTAAATASWRRSPTMHGCIKSTILKSMMPM